MKRIFVNIWVFVAIFLIISVVADLYYYQRIIVKEPGGEGQIAYSDFRVFWFASYNLYHHILKVHDDHKGIRAFRPFWFLSADLRSRAKPREMAYELYPVYDKNETFFYYRYSPLVATAIIPIERIFYPPTKALIVWDIILNAAFLACLLVIVRRLAVQLDLSAGAKAVVLWATFLGTLRFYLVNISRGQVDIFTALLFALFLISYVDGRKILSGIWLALILQFKPFFLPVIFYFLFVGEFAVAVSAVFAFAGCLILPSYLFGISHTATLTREWFEIVTVSVSSQLLNPKNYSITHALAEQALRFNSVKGIFTSPERLFLILSGGLTLAAYAWLVIYRRLKHKFAGFRHIEVSVLIIISIIVSPIAWNTYFINLAVPLAVAVSLIIKDVKNRRPFYLMGAFFILSCVMGTDITKYLPLPDNLHYITVSLGALALMLALVSSHKNLNIK